MSTQNTEEDSSHANKSEGVEHETDRKESHVWSAKFFRVKIPENKIDEIKSLDPVGRRVAIARKLKLLTPKKLEQKGLMGLPIGQFDHDLDALCDTIESW